MKRTDLIAGLMPFVLLGGFAIYSNIITNNPILGIGFGVDNGISKTIRYNKEYSEALIQMSTKIEDEDVSNVGKLVAGYAAYEFYMGAKAREMSTSGYMMNANYASNPLDRRSAANSARSVKVSINEVAKNLFDSKSSITKLFKTYELELTAQAGESEAKVLIEISKSAERYFLSRV